MMTKSLSQLTSSASPIVNDSGANREECAGKEWGRGSRRFNSAPCNVNKKRIGSSTVSYSQTIHSILFDFIYCFQFFSFSLA